VSDAGALRTWVIAFVALAGALLGAFVGVGCALKANACPFRSSPRQTSTDGATLFLANCAACHGRDAAGMRDAPSLVSGDLAALDPASLAAKIARGKPLAGMPAFRRSLTPEQIDAVARYLVSVRGSP
jgi:ubiquinol-cytochrome c reductase cytochrome c subunit